MADVRSSLRNLFIQRNSQYTIQYTRALDIVWFDYSLVEGPQRIHKIAYFIEFYLSTCSSLQYILA